MEKRAFIAVLVSIVIIMLWNVYIQRMSPPVERQKQETVTKEAAPTAKTNPPPPRVEPSTPNQPSGPLPIHEAQQTFPVKEVSVETPNYIAKFTTQGARLKSFKLKHYRASVKKTSPLIEMVEHTPGMPYPLGIRSPGYGLDSVRGWSRDPDIRRIDAGRAAHCQAVEF
jgi:YidC/Oxa1 family membrane protein insertase